MGSLYSNSAKRRAISLMLSSPDPLTAQMGPARPRSLVTKDPALPTAPASSSPSKKGCVREDRKQQEHRLQLLRGPGPWLISSHSCCFPRSSESTVGTAADSTAHGQAESWRGPVWSQGQVLASTSPGWRTLRKSLHLSKPVSSSVRRAVERIQ